jgi:hypothetical protein
VLYKVKHPLEARRVGEEKVKRKRKGRISILKTKSERMVAPRRGGGILRPDIRRNVKEKDLLPYSRTTCAVWQRENGKCKTSY